MTQQNIDFNFMTQEQIEDYITDNSAMLASMESQEKRVALLDAIKAAEMHLRSLREEKNEEPIPKFSLPEILESIQTADADTLKAALKELEENIYTSSPKNMENLFKIHEQITQRLKHLSTHPAEEKTILSTLQKSTYPHFSYGRSLSTISLPSEREDTALD